MLPSIRDKAYPIGEYVSETLPAATGGNGRLTYDLTPSIPGLTFDAGTRTLYGTPRQAGTYHMRYRVQDEDGDADGQSFPVTVNAPAPPPENQPPTVHGSFSDGILMVGTTETLDLSNHYFDPDGDALTYDATSDDPAVTTVSVANDVLTITAVAAGTATITVTVSDGSNAVSQSFTVTVQEHDTAELVLSGKTLTVAEGGSATYTVKLATQPSGLVTVTVARADGGDADLSANPTELTFDALNWSMAQAVIITAAQDADATNGAATFTHTAAGRGYEGITGVEVAATEADDDTDTEPTFGDATVPGGFTEDVSVSGHIITQTSLYYTAGEAITPLTLPEARGGNGILSYSLFWSASAYRDELTFDQATRTISGTPVTVRAYQATYRATDEDGDTATLEFLIWIKVPCEATVRGGCAHPPSPSPIPSGGPVSIEVVFADDVPRFIRDVVLSAARWWESAFVADFGPPMTVYAGDSCGSKVFAETRVVDDMLISVSMFDPPEEEVIVDGYWIPHPTASGGPCARRDNSLPYLGQVNFIREGVDTMEGCCYEDWVHPVWAYKNYGYNLARHEMAHALGFGVGYRWNELIRDGSFHGPAAMAEHDGLPVPTTGVWSLTDENYHWDSEEFYDQTGSVMMGLDIMASTTSVVLPVTLAAFQDIGFEVDYSVAELPACETKHHSLFRPGDCFDLPGIQRW